MVFEKVRQIAMSQMRIKDENLIRPEMSIKNELKADSLDLTEMLMTLEEEFNIEIPTERAKELKTIDEVVRIIEELTSSN